MRKLSFIICLIGLCLAATGCSSISKGVAQAVLEHETADKRVCEINGTAFDGIRTSIEKQQQNKTTKVLMVHGISRHLPGYSTRFKEKLVRSLGLNTMDKQTKEFRLGHLEENAPNHMANLRITRHQDKTGSRSLIFYELTWSPLTDQDKQMIAFDTSEGYNYQRAEINKILKDFMNSTVPDLLIYRGNKEDDINTAVSQSVCWMFKGGWHALPTSGVHECVPWIDADTDAIKADDFYFVTHSLGSRITLDTVNVLTRQTQKATIEQKFVNAAKALQDKKITVFMLANQLPLLQMGREKPAVTRQIDAYCTPSKKNYKNRMLKEMRIVAFSDPNDILSYPVPHDFAANNIDSRICPEVVNVNINIAPVKDVFGATSFADPLQAHGGYHEDDRVIGLITDGISRENTAPIIDELCHWTELK